MAVRRSLRGGRRKRSDSVREKLDESCANAKNVWPYMRSRRHVPRNASFREALLLSPQSMRAPSWIRVTIPSPRYGGLLYLRIPTLNKGTARCSIHSGGICRLEVQDIFLSTSNHTEIYQSRLRLTRAQSATDVLMSSHATAASNAKDNVAKHTTFPSPEVWDALTSSL